MTRDARPLGRGRTADRALAIPFAFALVVPAIAYVGFVVLGGWRFAATRRLPTFGGILLGVCFAGAVAHILATATWADGFAEPVPPPPGIEVAAADGTNLLAPDFMRTLQGHSYGHVHVAWGGRDEDGFWVVPRYEPGSGDEVDRIRGGGELSVMEGVAYTVSFYIRGPDPAEAFSIVFRTPSQPHVLEPEVRAVGEELWRVHATWIPGASTELVHAFEVSRFAGTWSHLSVGWVQVEEGPEPTAYRPPIASVPRGVLGRAWKGVAWWLGTGVLGVATLAGATLALARAPRWAPGAALVLGLAIQMAVALAADQARGTALAPHPNVLGHSAVLGGLAAGAIGPPAVGAIGLAIAGATIASSGSRAAFVVWAWAVAVGAALWLWRRFEGRRVRRRVVAGIASLVIVGVALVLLASPRLRSVAFEPWTVLQDENVVRRTAIWRVAGEAVRTSPWFGVGVDRFGTYLAEKRPVGSAAPRALHAHNTALHVAAESGLVVSVGLLALFGRVLHVAVRRRMGVTVGFVAALAALASVDHTLFTGLVFLPVLIVLARTGGAARAGTHSGRAGADLPGSAEDV